MGSLLNEREIYGKLKKYTKQTKTNTELIYGTDDGVKRRYGQRRWY